MEASADGAGRGIPAFRTVRKQDLRRIGDLERAARELNAARADDERNVDTVVDHEPRSRSLLLLDECQCELHESIRVIVGHARGPKLQRAPRTHGPHHRARAVVEIWTTDDL